MKVIYVCSSDVSVYDSQVLGLLTYIQKLAGVNLTLIQGFKNQVERKSLERKLFNHDIDVVWMKWSPTYPLFEIQKVKVLSKALYSIETQNDAVIHVRGDYVGYITKKVVQKCNLQIPVLVDVRGVSCEERKYMFPYVSGLKNYFLIRIIQKYFKKSDSKLYVGDNAKIKITSVSPLINKYIEIQYPNCNYSKICNPNIAGSQFVYSIEHRRIIRQELGIKSDDIVAICSTKGNDAWQKDFKVIKKLVELGIKVVNLSPVDPHISGCITTMSSFSDMPKYLSAADIAVLWRDNTFMNNSASPSKFSEFAVMGLYVIHNSSVAVATSYIEKSGAGMLVHDIEQIEKIPSIEELQNNRALWISEGLKTFGIEQLGLSYYNAYKSMLE